MLLLFALFLILITHKPKKEVFVDQVGRKTGWVNEKLLTKPKQKDGIGIKYLRCFNKILLGYRLGKEESDL